MTDKQIIIDGVNVSECLFYQTNFEEDYDVKIKHYCSNWHNSCETNNNSNCYYKQLQREKQNLQEAIDTSIKEFNRAEELKTLLKRKEQECEDLKKKKEENTTFYLKKYANKDSGCLELEHKLKQAEEKLKRIREFATALCYTVMSDGVVILQKDILKIIDEVENEN